MNIATNSEMFDRIIRQVDMQARMYWDRLVDFSRRRQLLETSFDARCADNFHSCFWEIYLPAAFDARGIALRRTTSKKKGGPDFYFNDGSRSVWVEAIACGEPSEKNGFSPPSDDPTDFDSGLAPESKIMQRLASSISAKITQSKRHRARLKPQDSYIIALNGYRALNGFPHDDADNGPPFIVRTVFGVGDCTMSDGKTRYRRAAATDAGAPLGQFFKPENKHISGLFYSATHCWETAIPIGQNCFFIQNPLAGELAAISSRFPTWKCGGDGQMRSTEPNG